MRILLVTHEASRTGAPRIALLVADTLAARGHHVSVVSRRSGPLMADFRQAAPSRLEPLYRLRRPLWYIRGARRVAPLLDALAAALVIARSRADVVYLNSLSSSTYIRPALWLRRRVVVHAHESGEVGARFLKPTAAARLLPRTQLVACSPSVRDDLAALAGVPASAVSFLPSVPDSRRILTLAEQSPDREYADDELVIGCCGSVEHRKGPDLWLEAARRVRAAVPDRKLRFVWLGEIVDRPADPTGGPDVFLGPSPNPYAHMRRFDIATLPSRDDPFPLVVLESMLVGTPVVAFATGSVPEQIGDAGLVVPPGDVDGFAAAIAALVLDDRERARLGRTAAQRARSVFSTEAFADDLDALLRTVMPGRPND